MRILHLSKFYPPDPGGLEHVVATLAEGAARAGHNVRVVCARGSAWRGDATEIPTRSDRHGVSVLRVDTPAIWWSQPIAPGYLRAARWRADVAYVHRPHPLADVAALFARSGRTIVFHHSDIQRQRIFRAVYRPLSHAVVHRAYATVVGAEANLQHAHDLGPAGIAKARVIPFGVDERRFSPTPPDEAPSVFRESAGTVGLFVGRLVSYKGLDVLLRAVAGTGLHVVIVGEGPLRDSLQGQVARGGMSDRVRIVGGVSDSELPAYYQSADYVLLPSTTPAEMFGVTMLEAMACGKAVVSTSVQSGMREVNVPDVTGLQVAPGDHEALRAAMERVAGDETLRRRFGDAGRRRVEERYTMQAMVDAHLALCAETSET